MVIYICIILKPLGYDERMDKMGECVLALTDICKRFSGVTALDHVSFDVFAGEVHALMGENGAGKSTLMKIINGIYKADEGKIALYGEETEVSSPREAQMHGIAMIHQELNNIPYMTISENMFLGREPNHNGIVNRKKMNADTRELLKTVCLQIDPRTKMHELSVAQMQMVEIAKAISMNARIIIMDEPTSAISDKEVETLFQIIRKLREKQIAIIYISHKIQEVFEIASRITVLRDGHSIETRNANEFTRDSLIAMMVGRELTNIYPAKSKRPESTPLLEAIKLSNNNIHDVSFTLHSGEILGIGGLMGAGRSELLETLFGVRPYTKGQLMLHGRNIRVRRPNDAIKNGFAFVTEDRARTGLNLKTSIKRDMSIVTLSTLCRPRGIIRRKKENEAVDYRVRQLNIKTPSRNKPIAKLSGGNQQKVILGRWLMSSPNIVLLDEPTRGIDVGAKYEIYTIIQQMAQDGKGIIMVSGELPELIGVCDRVLMMRDGRIQGELSGNEMTQQAMMNLATRENEEA